jgi:hypothetical protein
LLKDDVEGLLAKTPTLAALIETQDPMLQLMSMLSLDIDNKSYRRQRLISMLHNEMAVLQDPWKILWFLFIEPTTDGIDKHPPTDDGIYKQLSWVPPSPPDRKNFKDSTDDPELVTRRAQAMREFQARLEDEQRQVNEVIRLVKLEQVLSKSQSIPTILSQYFLPMLYGLLGALTYILRSLSKEIQDVTFTRGSATRYSLRWPLGMLAGVTVGLFFDPARFSGLAAITPLGVAFLAGYGVELFFTGLDGLVRAFTGEGPERPKAEAA